MKKQKVEYQDPRVAEFATRLKELPTITQGHCCNLKQEDEHRRQRVWVCRVGGGITVERMSGGVWKSIGGGCMEHETPSLFQLRMWGVM